MRHGAAAHAAELPGLKTSARAQDTQQMRPGAQRKAGKTGYASCTEAVLM